MPYWSWIVLGVVLLAVELMMVDAAFFLIFIGLSAVITGVVVLLGVPLSIGMQYLLFGVLSAVSMLLFREKLYKKLRGGVPGYSANRAGQQVVATETIQAGETGSVSYSGSTWKAENVGEKDIENGAKAVIQDNDGILLKVVASD